MKIRIVVPIILDIFNQEIMKEVSLFKAPDMEIEIVKLDRGPASIESRYDDAVATLDIMEKVQQAERDGIDGVFIDCFGDPGVESSREIVSIPVVGAFQPAALTASLISDTWSVVTVVRNVVPILKKLARKLGVESKVASVRYIDTPVLELKDKNILQKKLLTQIEKAAVEDGAEAVVLGCTGMLGLARNLSRVMEDKGIPIPVIDPTATAIGYLELIIRSGLSQSALTYPAPPEKERKF
jgi:allantoin racemase